MIYLLYFIKKNILFFNIYRYCTEDSMDPKKVKGKLVECKLSRWGVDSVINGLGGIGTVIESEQFLDASQIYMAPATMVNSSTAQIITTYISSTR